jgi:hypothetical protein
MNRLFHRSLLGCLAACLALSSSMLPADAVTKKKKKATTKKKAPVTTVVTTLPALTPPPSSVDPAATTVPAPTVPATAPPATLPLAEQIAAGWVKMWKPRDIWAFEADLKISADTETFRKDLNRRLGVEFYVASDARLVITPADDKLVAIVLALAGDPKLARPDLLQALARQAAARFSNSKPLKVEGGFAMAGTTPDGLGLAITSFDNYYIEVVAVDRQRAQDAAFLVTTNMGRQLTE